MTTKPIDNTKSYYCVKPQNREFKMACDFINAAYDEYYGNNSSKARRTLKKIQIAGTNGKGSTAAMLASILQEAGLKVGLYTSPALCCVNERISINGVNISDEKLESYIPYLRKAEERLGFEFGGFERITAASYLYFLDENVDFAVMETGLGGRFDTVSAVDKLILASLTTIDRDHMQMLGNTPSKIALDKCGIMRPGVPVVSHPQITNVRPVLRDCAAENDTSVTYAISALKVSNVSIVNGRQRFSARLNGKTRYITLDLTGSYQCMNAANAICCALKLNEMGLCDITTDTIIQALSKTHIRGRGELVHVPEIEASVYLDGAHNPNAIKECMRTFVQNHPSKRKYVAIISIMKDKDIVGIISQMYMYLRHVICVDITERSLPAEELAALFAHYGVSTHTAKDVKSALMKADMLSHGNEIILATGSFYLAGEILKLSDKQDKN